MPKVLLGALVEQLETGCEADAGEDPGNAVHLYHCAWHIRDNQVRAAPGLEYGGKNLFTKPPRVRGDQYDILEGGAGRSNVDLARFRREHL